MVVSECAPIVYDWGSYIGVVLLATVAQSLLGFFFYGPVFGKAFIRLAYPQGFPPPSRTKSVERHPDGTTIVEERSTTLNFQNSFLRPFISSIIGAIFSAVFLAFLISHSTACTVYDGVKLGIFSLLLLSSSQLVHAFWEGKPLELVLLNELFNSLAIILQAAIITFFSPRGYH